MYPGYYPQVAYQYPAPRGSAPFSVHLTAFVMYLIGIVAVAAAALVWAVGRHSLAAPTGLPAGVGRGGLSIVIGLAVYALCWLLVARKLQRGRQWARVLVLVLSALSVLGGVWQVYAGSVGLAAGQFVVPVLFLMLLNTRAARSWFRFHTY